MAKRSTKPNQRNAEERARIEFADKAAADMNAMVRAYQAAGYDMFIEFLAGEIETDGGRIVYSNKHLPKVQRLVTMFHGWGNKFKRYILKPILQAAEKLLGLNREYFDAIATVKDSLMVRSLFFFQCGCVHIGGVWKKEASLPLLSENAALEVLSLAVVVRVPALLASCEAPRHGVRRMEKIEDTAVAERRRFQPEAVQSQVRPFGLDRAEHVVDRAGVAVALADRSDADPQSIGQSLAIGADVCHVVAGVEALQHGHDIDRGFRLDRVVAFDGQPLMVRDGEPCFLQYPRFAHVVLGDGGEHVPTFPPAFDLFDVAIHAFAVAAMSGDFREGSRVHDPVPDLEVRLALPQAIHTHECRVEVLSVGGLMQAHEQPTRRR